MRRHVRRGWSAAADRLRRHRRLRHLRPRPRHPEPPPRLRRPLPRKPRPRRPLTPRRRPRRIASAPHAHRSAPRAGPCPHRRGRARPSARVGAPFRPRPVWAGASRVPHRLPPDPEVPTRRGPAAAPRGPGVPAAVPVARPVAAASVDDPRVAASAAAREPARRQAPHRRVGGGHARTAPPATQGAPTPAQPRGARADAADHLPALHGAGARGRGHHRARLDRPRPRAQAQPERG